jgi:DNA-binding response OmpR family regulator
MKRTTILIVDDETNIRLMLRTTLMTEGYHIFEAGDGREALNVIDREMPDLMILDLSMPVLDGMGVLNELKGMRPDKKPRVIVLTAYGSISTAVKATRLGAMDFLEKPISPDEVRESVAAVLAEPLPRPQADSAEDSLSGGYAGVLDRIRKAMRLAKYADAETLLMKAADLAHNDAAYFNLLGILYEARREHRLARKFYGKAIAADKRYEPAQINMRRLYELNTFGRTQQPVTLGDEPDVWYAKLPDSPARV